MAAASRSMPISSERGLATMAWRALDGELNGAPKTAAAVSQRRLPASGCEMIDEGCGRRATGLG